MYAGYARSTKRKIFCVGNESNDFDLGDPSDQRTLCFGGSGEPVGNVRQKGRTGFSPFGANDIPSDHQRGGVGDSGTTTKINEVTQ
jgi:hypothetical protein